jgi:hypothetical protein
VLKLFITKLDVGLEVLGAWHGPAYGEVQEGVAVLNSSRTWPLSTHEVPRPSFSFSALMVFL